MLRHRQLTNRSILIGSFCIPVIIMMIYFIYRGMAPFGASSLLTVDLGQQYVDFFSSFRRIILHHPTELFYSFSKGLGGEMLGTNAYYLFSPLNLILLFFPGASLTSGIMVITLLRYGLASLALAWCLQRLHWQQGVRIWAFSTAYSLNGWMIANQLNMIWLDALIILPLIFYGLVKIIRGGSVVLYVSWLAVMIIDNYYMAWMICLFSILLVLWLLPEAQSWHQRGKVCLRYIWSSLLAVGCSAIVLLPTIFALLQSKGTYTETTIHSRFEYNPLKILAKLVPGSFNFDQMPSGQPNIYVGMLITMGLVLYLLNRKVKWQQRLIAFFVTVFLVISFCYEPLDLLWHVGQFPVWYPARFSFVFCFWVIILAARTITDHFQAPRWQVLVLLLLTCAITYYVHTLHVSYISPNQITIGFAFALISIAYLAIQRRYSPVMYDLLFIILVICDVATSALVSLSNLAYVSQPEFGNYTTALNAAISKIPTSDHEFHRVAKTIMRTKDDPLQSGFNSGDHFGSTLEPQQPAFMGAIGQPDGDGFISYANGTQVSDALLGFKYTLSASDNQDHSDLPFSGYRPDWFAQQPLTITHGIGVRKNRNALPIAFGANKEILTLGHTTLDPLTYQSQIFQSLAGKPVNQPLFNVQNFTSVDFINVQRAQQITGTTFKKRDPSQPALVRLKFTPPTNDSYYLTIGPSVKDGATIMLNNKRFSQYNTYRNTVVINVAHRHKGRPVIITLRLKKNSLWMENVSLYQLNQRAFNTSLKVLKQSTFQISHMNATTIKGRVTIHHGQSVLMTTIPAATGWHVKVDGHSATPQTVLGIFMAIPMKPGTHTVVFHYRPPYLYLGALLTVLSISLTVVISRYHRRHQ